MTGGVRYEAQTESHGLMDEGRDAVILRREGDFLLRVGTDGKAERVPVRAGTVVGDLIEVIGTVKPGDRLVVRGGERVEPGQAVTVEPATRAPVAVTGTRQSKRSRL